jgi:pilus assembly protein Flp/PilA
MLALIIVVCLVAITALGQQVNNTFSTVQAARCIGQLSSAQGRATGPSRCCPALASPKRCEESSNMGAIARRFVDFLKTEDGPTAVEYAVMLALIIAVCLAAIGTLGSQANNTFSTTASKIEAASS